MKTITPYEDGKSKKEQVRAMFDAVAGRYDALNRALSLGVDIGWRIKLIKRLKSFEPKHVLDMATGTADLAVMAAKRIDGCRVTGVDLSPNMIRLGQSKVKKKQLEDKVELKVGDSEDIRDEEGTYDGAMVAFGVRNFEDLDRGLSELNRVLKPGAPLFVLEFSKPTIFPIKHLFNTYFRFVVPVIGRIFSKDKVAYQYLYDSVQNFPDYEDMAVRLQTAGFKNCKWSALTFGICCLYEGIK